MSQQKELEVTNVALATDKVTLRIIALILPWQNKNDYAHGPVMKSSSHRFPQFQSLHQVSLRKELQLKRCLYLGSRKRLLFPSADSRTNVDAVETAHRPKTPLQSRASQVSTVPHVSRTLHWVTSLEERWHPDYPISEPSSRASISEIDFAFAQTCGVCLEPLLAEQVLMSEIPVLTPCGHIFGANCLQTWYHTPGPFTCPMCREPLNHDILFPDGLNGLSIPLYALREKVNDDPASFLHMVVEERIEFKGSRHRIPFSGARGLVHVYRTGIAWLITPAPETVPIRRGMRGLRRVFDTSMLKDGLVILTRLNDDSQAWRITDEAIVRGTLDIKHKEYQVVPGARYVVLNQRLQIIRWLKSYDDWKGGF